jgi:hypothetical protein
VPEAFEPALDAVGQEPDAVVAVSDASKMDSVKPNESRQAQKLKNWSVSQVILESGGHCSESE